jgi:transcriptional regulator NrdR family protein
VRAGLACPTCGGLDSDVKDTRSEEGGGYIRRRRECVDCKFRYTTREVIDTDLNKILASHEIVVRLSQVLKNIKE